MATEVFQFTGAAGTPHYLGIFNTSGQVFDWDDSTFKALASATDKTTPSTEKTDMGGAKSGFVVSVDLSLLNSGSTPTKFFCDWYTDTGATTCVSDTAEFTVTSSAIGSGGLDAAGIMSAVGLASANLDTQLSTIDDFLDTEIAAIKAKTDNLPSDPADASDIAAALSTLLSYVDTEVAAIKTVTDNLATAIELDGSVYRFTTNALEQAPSPASLTITELTSTPGASPTFAQVMAFVYMQFRNKFTVTKDLRTMHNDAGDPVMEQAIDDDGTTFTRDQWEDVP